MAARESSDSSLAMNRCVTRRGMLGLVLTAAGLAASACSSPAAPAPTTATKPAATTAPAPAATTAPKPAPAPTTAPTQAPVQSGAAKPLAGVTLNGAMHEAKYPNLLKTYIPEFEALTGAKVNLELNAFAVYNQRADLELSTKGSSWDFVNVTFIYTGRWIGAGWVTNLEEYIKDPNKTPKEWDADEFVSGAVAPLRDAKGNRYGFPHEAGAVIGCASRGDILDKAGVKMPTTFDEMVKVFDAIHDKEGVKAFVTHNLHHWYYPQYVHGFGGDIFKQAPDNVTPTLDSPEAIKAADFYANLLRSYTPEGVLSYTEDQCAAAQAQGRANIWYNTTPWLTVAGDPKKSSTAATARYAMFPAGPKGAFPSVNCHGIGIPIGSKNKAAAWEFIKWAMSKEMMKRAVVEQGFSAPCRMSVINTPEFKKSMVINGFDVADLFMKTLELPGKSNYMVYRTVQVFPQVGDPINRAIAAVATKQKTAEAAMKEAQTEAVAALKKAGVKIDA